MRDRMTLGFSLWNVIDNGSAYVIHCTSMCAYELGQKLRCDKYKLFSVELFYLLFLSDIFLVPDLVAETLSVVGLAIADRMELNADLMEIMNEFRRWKKFVLVLPALRLLQSIAHRSTKYLL